MTTPHHHRFSKTYCSQCGKQLGPGDSGVSRCADHQNTKRRAVLYDPKCEDLAEYFLSGDHRCRTLTTTEYCFHVRALAEDIQTTIENYSLPEE